MVQRVQAFKGLSWVSIQAPRPRGLGAALRCHCSREAARRRAQSWESQAMASCSPTSAIKAPRDAGEELDAANKRMRVSARWKDDRAQPLRVRTGGLLPGKEADCSPASERGGDGDPVSPRHPLSPSNFNSPHLSPSPPTPAGAPSRRKQKAVPSRPSANTPSGGPITRSGGPSPVATDMIAQVARGSPRDAMNISHLLSSSRSPWSPRHFGGSRAGPSWGSGQQPPRITNTFQEGSSVAKPTTQARSKISLGSGKRSSPAAAANTQQAHAPAAQRGLKMPSSTEPDGKGKGKCVVKDEPVAAAPGRTPAVREDDQAHMPVHLFVAAIGDGELNPNTAPKTRETLAQIIKKVSKEQNTVVNVKGEGPLHIQLRVFVASSIEARTLKEYIHANQEQTPCPFILLAKELPMAVMYDQATLNPANANVADRLRKQAKTRAIKLLREVIWDDASKVTAAMLRGRHGPLIPWQRLEGLIQKRSISLPGTGARWIAFPVVRRQEEAMPGDLMPLLQSGCQHTSFGGGDAARDFDARGKPGVEQGPRAGAASRRGDGVLLQPAATADSARARQNTLAEQHFPVSLTVLAIGEGPLVRNTQPKLLQRLKHLTTKVPKEHHCYVDLPGHSAVPLKLRLFVTNSEDAKAACEYVSSNQGQRPTPFVILSYALPIAVSYDSRSLDVSDANVVDCLRKQAKTRAVKLIKEVMADPVVGVSLARLRGHEGADALAAVLQEPLMRHATPFGGGKRYISFAARNRSAHENSTASADPASHLGDVQAAAGSVMSGLDSLAHAAGIMTEDTEARVRREDATDPGPQAFTMNWQRVCEMCQATHDGSYGTGRFCSKSCRYEAHALRVAEHRRTHMTLPQSASDVSTGLVKLEDLPDDLPEDGHGQAAGKRKR